jgi:hypothetical protein
MKLALGGMFHRLCRESGAKNGFGALEVLRGEID